MTDLDGLEGRVAALERALADVTEQQAATAQVLKVIGGSPFDLAPVFDMVLSNALRLCRAQAGQIWRFEGDGYHPVQISGGSAEYQRLMSDSVIRAGRGTVVGKVALERRTVLIPDVLADPDYSSPEAQKAGGYRTLLGVPMMREGLPIGVITLWRPDVDPFTIEQIDLASTFAAQGAIAIANVELLRQLDEKNRQLEIASRHKSEFLAHMSHELRTPLNAVIGFSEVLLERMFGDLNAKQEEYLNDILSSGRHLLELINDVLDVSKVEAGRMKLELGRVSLGTVLRDAVMLSREQALQSDLTLALDVEPGLPDVRGDERRIRQVAANLVSNAVKFTPAGGRVDVSARYVDGEAQVSVTDTGIGIALEDQEAIFEAFKQVPRGPEPIPEGTGLGLTLSREIVVLHGGRLWVESEPGAGSTFTIALPVAGRADVERGEEPVVSQSGHTVLLVEDDEHSIDLLTLYLEEAGFEVAVARDGPEGLELARRHVPVGIVLDILLPTLDGWEFLALAKADPGIANVPVIIVSMIDERGKGLALGAADYLVKPVSRHELLEALDRVTAPGSPATILAIDDDPMAIELIEAVLVPAGHIVLTARSGAEGVAVARAEVPDVVLLDLVMPEVDGFMVVEQLLADPATAEIPIVVLTSKSLTAEDKERLKGRIVHLARKAEFSRAALLALVGRFAPAEQADRR